MSDPYAWRSNMDIAPPELPPRSPLAELKPGPRPTGHDRVFDAAYGFLGGTPDKRSMASALAGLFDVGTLGMATGAYDGGAELARGGGPQALGMALMPGAKVAGPAAKVAGKAATEAVQGIRAFHGSPHDFDRFDLSKIGTGEGAQAYGHGLYFAESEGVAKGYKDRLGGAKYRGSSNPAEMAFDDIQYLGSKEAALASWRDNVKNRPNSPGGKASAEKLAAYERGDVDALNPGRMYEVNIKASPDDFLDWDKPISEQSEKVRKAFEGANVAPLYGTDRQLVPIEQRRGEAAYHSLAEGLGRPYDPARPRMPEKPDPVAATQYLKERGIAGTRYLDGGSRDGGQGTRNVALFDDSLIEILRKYGLMPPAVAGGAIAAQDGGDQ